MQPADVGEGVPCFYISGDAGSIPEPGRSPGKWKGNPFQYSFLENLLGRGAWKARVHGVAKSWTQLMWLSTRGSQCNPTLRTLALILLQRLDMGCCLYPGEKPIRRGPLKKKKPGNHRWSIASTHLTHTTKTSEGAWTRGVGAKAENSSSLEWINLTHLQITFFNPIPHSSLQLYMPQR